MFCNLFSQLPYYPSERMFGGRFLCALLGNIYPIPLKRSALPKNFHRPRLSRRERESEELGMPEMWSKVPKASKQIAGLSRHRKPRHPKTTRCSPRLFSALLRPVRHLLLSRPFKPCSPLLPVFLAGCRPCRASRR